MLWRGGDWFVTEISGEHIGTIYKGKYFSFILHSKIAAIHCPVTSVTNPRYTSAHKREELYHFKGADFKLYVMCASSWNN